MPKKNTFSAFKPAFRGREVKGYPALDPGAIKTFGLIIADRQDGPFRLEIDWIKAFAACPLPGLQTPARRTPTATASVAVAA